MRFEYSDGRMPNVMTKGSTAYYLTYDQVGSLRAVYDATGAIVKRMDYDSFGNIIADTNPTFTVPFGFAGGLDDRDIGLVHFGFRDYDPATGRWTAKDPIGFAGGDVETQRCQSPFRGQRLLISVRFFDIFLFLRRRLLRHLRFLAMTMSSTNNRQRWFADHVLGL